MDNETQEETQEETSEEVEETINSSEEESEDSVAEQLEFERKAKQQLTARAKKVEAKYKELEEKYKKLTENSDNNEASHASPDVDERVLKANGMPDDLLKELKAVAQVRGVGLIEAQADPVFKGIKENYEKETKAKQASLGASRGSNQSKPKKSFQTPGLTREEHKELYKHKFN